METEVPTPQEHLCPQCKQNGRSTCKFREIAQRISGEKRQAKTTHKIITWDRDYFRKIGCPYINDVDPDYPGKEKL